MRPAFTKSAQGYQKTSAKHSSCMNKRRNVDMRAPRTIWGGCMRREKVLHPTQNKPLSGTENLRSKAMQSASSISEVCIGTAAEFLKITQKQQNGLLWQQSRDT